MAYGKKAESKPITPTEAATLAADILPKAKLGVCLTWVTLIAYFLLFAINNTVAESGSWRFFLVQTLPLAIFIPGMVKQRYKTYSWLCFATLLYFTAYVVEVGSPMGTLSDIIGLVLSIVLFIAAMYTSRWLQHGQYYDWLATQPTATETDHL